MKVHIKVIRNKHWEIPCGYNGVWWMEPQTNWSRVTCKRCLARRPRKTQEKRK